MTKITFIGAGSAKFVRGALARILDTPELADVRIALMDIDAVKLARTEALAKMMARGKHPEIAIEATTDQRRALEGASYVIVTVMVGGMKYYASDTFIPERHGLSLAVGDTSGPGAVFRLIRTAPVLRQIADNLRDVSPDALVINYANPMALLTRALHEYGHTRVVGLCHSITSSIKVLAGWLGIPAEEIDYTAAGVNHLSCHLKIERNGRDLYPDLRAKSEWIVRNATNWEADTWKHEARGYERIRIELLKLLGCFPAEGPWHQGDFYGWFRKTPESVKHYGPPAGWAYNFDLKLGEAAQRSIDDMLAGKAPLQVETSTEAEVPIIRALETGTPYRFHGNVRNDGLIDDFPSEAFVEVPCRIDERQLKPDAVGTLPPQLAAAMQPHVAMHGLAMRGVLGKDRAMIRRAIALDPLTQAALTLPRIDAMVDDLFAENAAYMKDWS